MTLDEHDKHNYLSYSQQKGPFRVLTATLFTAFKEVSKNQGAAFCFAEELPVRISKEYVKTINLQSILTII